MTSQTLAVAGKSLLVADSGNGAIRLLTHPRAVIPMLEKMRAYLASFGMPKQEEKLTLQRCKDATLDLSNYFEEMARNNMERSSKGLRGEGPYGNVSNVNRAQLKWMLHDGLDVIESELKYLGHGDLILGLGELGLRGAQSAPEVLRLGLA